jgi:DNA primase
MNNSDVEEIKSRLNIVDVLGDYIRLDKAGANWKALCPFHNEKTPSFMVNEEKQFWHCFGCQKHGDIFTFIMEMEGLDFREALKTLAEKAGVKLKAYNPEKIEEKNRTLEILELATKFYEVQLWKGNGKIKILNYLRERGLSNEAIKNFRLGYAPRGWQNALSFLSERGYKLNEILKTGLLVEKKDIQTTNDKFPMTKEIKNSGCYDRFRDRIIFPVADYSGKIVGYSARVAPGGDESQAKYINTPETEVYHKSRILYGIDKAKSSIKKNNWALLVEGNMDAIASSQAGIENVIAVSGTALTKEQIAIIKRYASKIKMFFDMDDAGAAATKKSVKACLIEEIEVEIVSLPKGKDAAELAQEDPEKLKKATENALSVMDYFFEKNFKKFDKSTAAGKKKISEEILDIISSLGNAVEKNHWIKKLSQELETSEKALTDELKKINLNDRLENKSSQNSNDNKASVLSREEILIKEISGLMLVYREVWKETKNKIKERELFFKDDLLKLMLEKGEEANFDFDIFIKFLDNDKILKEKAEKAFFEKKYQLGLNNNWEEIEIPDPLSEMEKYLNELDKEKKREELVKIAADLKTARENNDKDSIELLKRESDKISKELAKLIA